MAMLLFWFWITNQLTVTKIRMSIAFLISTQGLLEYSKLRGEITIRNYLTGDFENLFGLFAKRS